MLSVSYLVTLRFNSSILAFYSCSAQIRKRVGLIFQDFHLFPGTVYDNIALGNSTITPEDARHAAELIQTLDFIESLPLGFDTVLEDRGQNLSQGQRQLLAFMRVIALNPEILILDEATASIDPETEAAIQALHLQSRQSTEGLILMGLVLLDAIASGRSEIIASTEA
ncbi:MAG: ATP-binding cassette domain-containing protein [Nostoc sp. DedQUE08]|uniref:ATP-binding cassette domain-containing protein n=1 Tax=Nostoc sp. DedQUE08 TaxID=3075393 RepID=UPI002AD3EABC|nr:ATP-binding cassette domain-containing protein [Nostoc sp. DedQUE08]MDZ8066693.1 ATP-binding cassette domain-containing protein [Nostoc sp. DedQUE08]